MQTTVAVEAWIVTGAIIRKGASIGMQASIGTGASVQTTMAVMAISDVAVLVGGRPAGRRDLGAMTMLRAMRAGAEGRGGGRPRGRRLAGKLHHPPGNVAAGRAKPADQLHRLCNEIAGWGPLAGQLRRPGNVAAGRGGSAGQLLLRPTKVAAGMTTVMTALILAASGTSVPLRGGMVHRMARVSGATTGMMMRIGGGMTGVGAGRGRHTGRILRFATAGGETTAVAESSAGLPLGSAGNA